ncbi:MAG: D-aminoacylase [Candidatus Bathyarchaeota archaeon]
MFELVVRNGKVIDGTGSPWFWADIGIEDGLIAKVARNLDADKVIDASGLVVTPGWIDVHMHADHTVLGNTRLESYVHQGVTTATMGNCGLSMYPLHGHKDELIAYLKPFTSGLSLNWDWKTMDDFIKRVEAKGPGINLVPLIGHGSIRINVIGFDDRDSTEAELQEMKGLLREGMEQGAHGLSTGLGYPPGTFTKDEELVQLGHVLNEYGGLYTTHMRGNLENLEDTIRLGFKTGMPIQVSHLGSSCAGHKELHGRHQETTLKAIDEARLNGLDITADIYPYTAGSSLLTQVIPDWAHEGGVQKMLGRLRDPEIRARLRKEYAAEEGRKSRDFTKVMVTYVKSAQNKRYEGMSVAEIAQARGATVVDALCDLLLEENAEAMNVTFWGEQEDVDELVKHPAVMPCSDGWSHAPYGLLSQGRPHPRCYGAFPRYLRIYTVEKPLFTPEEAVRRMTSMPASRLGLQNRGVIKEGMAADLTIFNPEEIRDTATFSDPHRYPEGIPYVVVNGRLAIYGGEHTGELAGKVLRKR